MSASNFLENTFLNASLTGATYTGSSTVYVALYSAPGTELTDSGYSRQAVTFSVLDDTATNTADVTFGPAGADWDPVVSWAIVDQVTSGNVLFLDNLGISVAVLNTKSLVFGSTKISITIN